MELLLAAVPVGLAAAVTIILYRRAQRRQTLLVERRTRLLVEAIRHGI